MAGAVSYREATPSDVTEMVRCRVGDATIGPADPRTRLSDEIRSEINTTKSAHQYGAAVLI